MKSTRGKTGKAIAELFTKSCKHEMEDTHLEVKFLGDGFKTEKSTPFRGSNEVLGFVAIRHQYHEVQKRDIQICI